MASKVSLDQGKIGHLYCIKKLLWSYYESFSSICQIIPLLLYICFLLITLSEICQEWGSRRGVLGRHWGFLTIDMEDLVIPDVMNDVFLPQGRYLENFVLISQLEVCQEGGIKKGDTWRTLRVPDWRLLKTWSFLMSLIILFYPKEYTLKVSCWYLYWKCFRKGVSRRGILGGHWGFQTGRVDDRVISDVMNVVLLP